jgi:hypothetical protein
LALAAWRSQRGHVLMLLGTLSVVEKNRSSGPQLPIQAAVLDGLGDVLWLNYITLSQIGDGPGDLLAIFSTLSYDRAEKCSSSMACFRRALAASVRTHSFRTSRWRIWEFVKRSYGFKPQ